ncbi:MAG TPA: M17 family peptidase N-terminal domain-containing protein [Anaeromyxobacteraceae bacterium]|nr:M17 family peptidase N-terminal domain-containing protein [Anaeromyxobacteraceae bacterium]
MRRLEVGELSLATLDALDVDALVVLVGPERPLQGLAGLVDWRLCGALTRTLTGGLYAGAPGEALLVPTGGRLPAARVVAIGLPAALKAADFATAARHACEVLQKAGSLAFAVSLPAVEGADAATVARLWLEAGAAAPQARQVVLGEARTLLADLEAARAASGAAVELAPLTTRAAPMVR